MIATALLIALRLSATPSVHPDTVRDACADTAHTTRMAEQCLEQQEDSAEARLNHTVAIVIRLLSPGLRANLVRANGLWDDYRIAECRTLYGSAEAGSLASAEFAGCMTDAAESRERLLRSSYNIANMDTTRTGGCIGYRPAVELQGRLERLMFYGPPGFGETPKEDAHEWGLYVRLAKGLCVVDDTDPDGLTPPAADVRLVQLITSDPQYRQLRARVGQEVTVSGTLAHAETGHHHADLLLDMSEPPPGSQR